MKSTANKSSIVHRVVHSGLCLLALGWPTLAEAQIATWNGGNTFKSWQDAANWSPQVVPLNGQGVSYTVIVPDSTSLSYDGGGAGTVEALSFGSSAGLRINGGGSLTVTSSTVIRGGISVGGVGSAFTASSIQTVFGGYPSLAASDGGRIGIGASTYAWPYYNGSYTLLSSIGAGSRIELTNVSSLSVNYGDNGSWSYIVNVRTNGIIDLANLGQITGAGQDDWLVLNVDSGGSLLVPKLGKVSGRTIFNLANPITEFPALWSLSDSTLNMASNSTLRLPSLLELNSAGINLAAR